MVYHWNGDQMTQVFVLPSSVVQKHLRLCGSAQLKVLMWLSCHGMGAFDAEACAKAIGLSVADCTDALHYWIETGVLTEAGAVPAAFEAESLAPVSEVSAAKTQAETALESTVTRPMVVRPDMKEVIKRQKKDKDFAYLLNTVSTRLGRPITNADMSILLYLYDTVGLPIEVILMVTAYAVSQDKPHLRYIEKVALDWESRGITTMAAAEEHLCRLDRHHQAWAKLETVWGIHRQPTVGQMERAELWVFDRKVEDALLRKAYEICLEKTGKFQFAYINRVLESWWDNGYTSLSDVEQQEAKKTSKAVPKVDNTSLDTAAYDKMVDGFVPIYPADGKRNP